MIIRITLESHKLTQIIEKYFDDGGCFVATNYSSAEDYKEFMKNVESYNRYSMSPQRTKLKEKIVDTIADEREVFFEKNISKKAKILDMGWGSGALLVKLKKKGFGYIQSNCR